MPLRLGGLVQVEAQPGECGLGYGERLTDAQRWTIKISLEGLLPSPDQSLAPVE